MGICSLRQWRPSLYDNTKESSMIMNKDLRKGKPRLGMNHSESHAPDDTRDLLKSTHEGDKDALQELLARHMPWIRQIVRQRIGLEIGVEFDSVDVVQETVLRVLTKGPKYLVSDPKAFRALTARIAINVLIDKHRDLETKKRGVQRVIDLDRMDSVDGPRTEAEKRESVALLDLALELISQADREIIELRQFQGLSFEDVAKATDSTADAARMRFGRALKRVAQRVAKLKKTGLPPAWEI